MFADKYQNLEQGKVLDVSKLKFDGTGSVIANPPNLESKKSKKLYVEGLKLVANEVDQLMSALEQLERVEPGITEKYKDKIQELSLAPKEKRRD